MQEIKILFLGLGDAKYLYLNENQNNGDIYNIFLYDLFMSFDYDVDEKGQPTHSKEIQSNNEKIRLSINNLISKYKSTFPQVHQLNTFLKNLAENEKFFLLRLPEQLTQEEEYKLHMKLKSLNTPEFNAQQFDELFKSILDHYHITSPNTTKKSYIGESDKNIRTCRFCGRSKITGALFKNEAHAISEALGNKTMILHEECDECNSYFDQNIERDFITYLNLFRTFFGILNKNNKITSMKGKNFEYKNLGNQKTDLRLFSDEKEIIPLIFHETLTKQNIYKTLVKYALSVLDKIEPEKFSKTIEWIRNSLFKTKLPKIGVLSSYYFSFKEPPTIEPPSIMVYIRKNDSDLSLPYAVGEFHFTFLTFAFIIPTFSDLEPDFTIETNFIRFWQFFKHYNMTKKFKFEDFSDSKERHVQFNLSFRQANWDKQLENDSKEGKLDFLINAALEEHRTDNTKDI